MLKGPHRKVNRSAIVIPGASGDLAKRKLIPALSKLFEEGGIDNSTIVAGSGRFQSRPPVGVGQNRASGAQHS